MAKKLQFQHQVSLVTEATVSKWLKTLGEKVSADEPLVELETDKVNVGFLLQLMEYLAAFLLKKEKLLWGLYQGIGAHLQKKDLI